MFLFSKRREEVPHECLYTQSSDVSNSGNNFHILILKSQFNKESVVAIYTTKNDPEISAFCPHSVFVCYM
jgi:hypothetical protein